MKCDTQEKGYLTRLVPAHVFCAVLLTMPVSVHGNPTSVATDYDDAEDAYSTGNYASALRVFRLAAKNGDSRAQVRLGRMYFFGQGVPPNYEETLRWWLMAAQQGSADAQYLLAGLLAKGFGVPKDTEEAVSWLMQAAEQNHISSLLYLGQSYEHGLSSISPDGCAAAGWYRRAADLGDPLALLLLDNLLRDIAGKSCDSLRDSSQGTP